MNYVSSIKVELIENRDDVQYSDVQADLECIEFHFG